MKKFWLFILAVVVSFIPGIIGIAFAPTMGHSAWMNTMAQSVLTPAPWVFSVAWTILYFILGVALFLVIVNDDVRPEYKAQSYWAFGIQMVLNTLWTILFFGANMVGWSMVVLLLLVGVTIWLTRTFWGINRWAGVMVLIYLVWLLFATYLNATILFLN